MAHNYAIKKLARSIVDNKIIARNVYTTGQLSKGWFFSKVNKTVFKNWYSYLIHMTQHNENIIPNYLYIWIQDAEKKAGHSTLLADKPDLYEILVDDVKPEKWEEYLKHKGKIYIWKVK